MTLNCYKPKKEKLNLLRERIIVYQQKSYKNTAKTIFIRKLIIINSAKSICIFTDQSNICRKIAEFKMCKTLNLTAKL